MITGASDWTGGVEERMLRTRAKCAKRAVASCRPSQLPSTHVFSCHVPFRRVMLSVRPILLPVASCYLSRLARQFGLLSIASCSWAACLPSRLGRWSAVFPRVLLPSATLMLPGKAKIRGEWIKSVVGGGFDERKNEMEKFFG